MLPEQRQKDAVKLVKLKKSRKMVLRRAPGRFFHFSPSPPFYFITDGQLFQLVFSSPPYADARNKKDVIPYENDKKNSRDPLRRSDAVLSRRVRQHDKYPSNDVRTHRVGGTVNVTGGTYTSNGYNSPAVYSTADITVSDAKLTANNSEALVIEGKNSIVLVGCDVTGNMSDTKGTSSDENVHNVMIYQSMSGDADVGTSTFSMTGGTLTGKNGDLIFVTNTHCVLTLSGVTIVNEDEEGYLLRVTGNSASHGWGTAGSNGAQVEFIADAQTLEGDIFVDSISTLTMTLQNGSSFTGTINITENAEGGTAVADNAVVTIGSGCVWTLTGDCTLTSLINNGTINFNGYTITLADGTVMK